MLICASIRDRDPRIVRAKLAYWIGGVVKANRLLMEAGGIPPLYTSGVRYAVSQDSAQQQHILQCDEVLAAREADCKSLAAYRLGELQAAAGSDAEAERYELVVNFKDYDRDPLGVGLVPVDGIVRIWHINVRHPNGLEEDPSAKLRRA